MKKVFNDDDVVMKEKDEETDDDEPTFEYLDKLIKNIELNKDLFPLFHKNVNKTIEGGKK